MTSTKPTGPVARFRLRRCIGGFRIEPISEDAAPASAPSRGSRAAVAASAAGPLLQALCQHDPQELDRLRQGEMMLLVGELMVAASQCGMQIEPKGRLNDPVLHLSTAGTPDLLPGALHPFASLHGRHYPADALDFSPGTAILGI